MEARCCGRPPPRRLLQAMQSLAPQMQRLTHAEEWAFWHARPAALSRRSLLIWSGTRSVLHGLAENGVEWAGPSAASTEEANDKGRWSHLSCALPERRLLESLAQLQGWLAEHAPSTEQAVGKAFGKGGHALARIKPRWSCAGRGQRTLSGTLSADDERVVCALIAKGAVVEPFVQGARPWAIHGVITSKGQTLLGKPRTFSTNASGAPVGASQPAEVDGAAKNVLTMVVEEVVEHLRTLGWYGPFGLDILWLADRCYLMDLNARFTLGWSEGLGAIREDALRLVARDQWGHAP